MQKIPGISHLGRLTQASVLNLDFGYLRIGLACRPRSACILIFDRIIFPEQQRNEKIQISDGGQWHGRRSYA